MEGEVDPDFDPTTEEGQADINDETTPLIDSNDVSRNRIADSLRHLRENEALSQAIGLRDNTEHIELEELGAAGGERQQDPITAAKEKLQSEYENFNFDEVKLLEEKGVVNIRVKNQKNQKWTKAEKLFTEDGQIRERVLNLKGFQIASRGLLERLDTLNERVALENRIKDLQETLEEREADYMRQNQLLLDSQKREMDDKNVTVVEFRERRDEALRERDKAKQDFEEAVTNSGISQIQVENLQASIDRSIEEREELRKEINTKEEQLRQIKQALEDSERQVEQLKTVMNDETLTEEEREDARKRHEDLLKSNAELEKRETNIEKKLGLTTKEKVKRALLKYGLPLAFAVAVSSVVGVILASLKGVGNGVKKVGKGLADMGKKMAASIPGLLGSVIGFALRAGGELLKFVGNNIWILVVAIGVVLMKKMKA